jgi:hypothetical protein
MMSDRLHIYRPGEEDDDQDLRRQVRDAMRHLELASMILADVLCQLPADPPDRVE